MEKKEIQFFVSENGKCYIKEWLNKLDIQTRAKINVRLVRLSHGAYGDHKRLDSNLSELRFFFAKGYRIYFTEANDKLVLLLNAGDKGSQSKDIKKARMLLNNIIHKE